MHGKSNHKMVWKQYTDEAHLLPGDNRHALEDVDIDDYEDRTPEPMEFEYWVDWCVEEDLP